MRKHITYGLAALVLALTLPTLSAADQGAGTLKIAVVNLSRVLNGLEEKRDALKELENLRKEKAGNLRQLDEEMQNQNKKLNLPLAGCGGAETWIDAVEYLLVGASVIQMTTGVIHYGHRVAEDMCEGLSDFMEEKGYKKVKDIVGKALPNLHPTDAFNLKKQGVADFDLDRCIGCGQCYIVCQDAGGQCIEWDGEKRRPEQDQEKCLSCMICSFICPIDNPALINFKHVPDKKEVLPPVSK